MPRAHALARLPQRSSRNQNPPFQEDTVRQVIAVTLAIALSSASIAPLSSQPAPAPSQPGPREKLFVQRDALIALGFTGLTIAMFPIDKSAALRLQRDRVQNRKLYNRTATAFRYLGAPVSFIAAVAMYGTGRLGGDGELAAAGLHITESMVLASALTQVTKGMAGRARPRHFKDTLGMQPFDPRPRDFKVGRGWGKVEFQAFPSGHTSAAFAFASALVSESNGWRPQWTWWVAPIFYGGATLVGASRVYNNAHWASDVVLGAAFGTFAGLKVVRFNHANRGNKVDRFFLDQRKARIAGSQRIGWSFRW